MALGCGACRGQHRPHTCASRGGKRKASKAKEDEDDDDDDDDDDEAKVKAKSKRSGGKRRKLSVEAGGRVTLTSGPHAGSRATVAGGKQGYVVVKLDDGTTVNVRQSGLNILGATPGLTPGDVGDPAEHEEGAAAEGAADDVTDEVAVEKAVRAVVEAGVAPPGPPAMEVAKEEN